jgi:hypothetical protein
MRLLYLIAVLFLATVLNAREQWTPQQANEWYAKQPWMSGANYLPRAAINQLEMWQADTFDAKMIDEEMGWAEGLGFNVMRIFLHDIVWQQDQEGFLKRMETVLAILDKHHIRMVPVIFDSCWHPFPKAGKQPEPKPSTHNSGWVQSPGVEILKDDSKWPALKPYVVGVISHFKDDKRIMMWDLYNELDNMFGPTPYKPLEIPDKKERAFKLAQLTREWALSASPSQPVSCCIWLNHTKPLAELAPWERWQIESGDILNFHIYSNLDATKQAVEALKKYGRPLICTEYMARPTGSTFQNIMPYFKAEKIAAINWGFIDGKSQTKFAWDSWDKQYPADPELWFHDVLHGDGTPYRADEVKLIRELTGGK